MTTPLQDPLARASRRRLGAAALVLVAACQAAPRAPMTQAPDPTAGPSMASAPPSPPGSAPREERPASLRDLAPPTRVTLPFEVRPVGNQAGALLVAQEEGRAFVRLLDRDGALSASRLVAGRQVVSAHVGEAPLLLTAEGDDRLCVERLDREDAPRCSRARADRALTLGGALWLLEERTADEEVEAGPREAGDPAKRRPGEAKEPAPRGDQRPGEDVQIWGRKLEADGFGEPKRIGLGFARPLAGMGLLDAVGHDAGAHVVWYEARRERREGTRGIPQAALR